MNDVVEGKDENEIYVSRYNFCFRFGNNPGYKRPVLSFLPSHPLVNYVCHKFSITMISFQ